MVEIYVSTNEDGYIEGWGYSEYGLVSTNERDANPIEIPEDSPFFEEMSPCYKIVNGEIVKDEKKAEEIEEELSSPPEPTELELLREQVELLKKQKEFQDDLIAELASIIYR